MSDERPLQTNTGTVTPPSTELLVTLENAAKTRTSTWRRILRDPQAVGTLGILAVIFLLGLLTPWLAPHGPNDADLAMINAPVGTPGSVSYTHLTLPTIYSV